MFEPGKSGNPRGRPKGSYGGRMQALVTLDQLMARKQKQRRLIDALDAEFEKDPVHFFKTVIMPLLPRDSRVTLEAPGVINWQSLIGGPVEDDGPAALPPATDAN